MESVLLRFGNGVGRSRGAGSREDRRRRRPASAAGIPPAIGSGNPPAAIALASAGEAACIAQEMFEVAARGDAAGLDAGHARRLLHRKGDERDLPEIDFPEAPDTGRRIDARRNRLVADGETVDRADPEQRQRLPGAGHIEDEPGAHAKPVAVFNDLVEGPDRLRRIVLPQKLDCRRRHVPPASGGTRPASRYRLP